jgi:hypothetical protein
MWHIAVSFMAFMALSGVRRPVLGVRLSSIHGVERDFLRGFSSVGIAVALMWGVGRIAD